ncbi:DarT ssDNA thymidine ADP-ribosyltransferase family protein [Halomonas cupida]|uniref:DarT ssDNA thymidine ADP-ribosyltransferase family protein n=1 Tax=Halomonas cupida TaxID=44933 RepID=UPI003EF2EB2D
MFWIILIAVVLFIGFIIDVGASSRPSSYSGRERNRDENNGRLPPSHRPRLPKPETTNSLPQNPSEKSKKSAEERRLPAPESVEGKSHAISRDEKLTFVDDLAKSHGGEYLLAGKITDLIGKHINSQETALEFVFQELDGARKGCDEARRFAKSLGFLEGEYSGALLKEPSVNTENAQQAILQSSLRFAISPEQATRLRLFNAKNIAERWGLASPEVKNSRLLKALREVSLDDVSLVPSLDASLPIIPTANIKHISNRGKNLDFARSILSELGQSLNKSPQDILLLAVPELLEVHDGREKKVEPIDRGSQAPQETQERKTEEAEKPTYKSEIKAFVQERDIPYLVHFTDYRNLPSVMSDGLVPRLELESDGQGFYYNDTMRLDGVKGSVSTSVAFPNYKMFYRYRQGAELRKWVVLLIDNSVLWESDCLFCKHNAADKRIIHVDKNHLASFSSLKSMYDDEVGGLKRDIGLLRPYDPTDPQAEVLVMSRIPPDKINVVVFDSLSSKEHFSKHYPMKKAVVDTAFFSTRDYVRRRQVV